MTCRKRRIKCDERKPTCFNCERSKKVCLGYENLHNLQPRRRNRDTSLDLKDGVKMELEPSGSSGDGGHEEDQHKRENNNGNGGVAGGLTLPPPIPSYFPANNKMSVHDLIK